MKNKLSIAVSSLCFLVASVGYVAPVMAESADAGLPAEQMLADNSNGSAMTAPSGSDNGTMGSQPNSGSSSSDTNDNSNANQNSNSSNSDDSSSDATSSDDDY